MARLNVNPTRMELQNLKKRLQTAKKGHRLLKNKSDEMVRQFMVFNNLNKSLRKEVEEEVTQALKSFMFAQARENSQEIEEMLSLPSVFYTLTPSLTNIMGVVVPRIQLTSSMGKDILPYSILSGNSKLDQAIMTLNSLMEKIITLAEVEKTCEMLAEEIEKNKRRINALEFILIPQIEETIKFIIMKLDENERNNLIRLMKVKANMLEE